MKDGALGAGGDKEVVRGEDIVGLLPEEEVFIYVELRRHANGWRWERNRG